MVAKRQVEYFFSFRSPYSYLSAPRAFSLPERFDVDLVWRGVRPMAMRGQPLPRAKQLYILRDAAREAHALGLPFGNIHEMELLQEAGFHPLEVIRAATFSGAESLALAKGTRPEFGAIKAGLLADLVMVEENPIANLKVLYGTGTVRVNDATGAVERIGGIRYVMKDGILYDAKQLLADVEKMVAEAKKK